MKKIASGAEAPRRTKRLRFASSPPRVHQYVPTPQQQQFDDDEQQQQSSDNEPSATELSAAQARKVRKNLRDRDRDARFAQFETDFINVDGSTSTSKVWKRFEESAKLDRYEPFHSSEGTLEYEKNDSEAEEDATPERNDGEGEPDAWIDNEGRRPVVAGESVSVAGPSAANLTSKAQSSQYESISTIELLQQLQTVVKPHKTPAHALRALKGPSAFSQSQRSGRKKNSATAPSLKVESPDKPAEELFNHISSLCNVLTIDRGLYDTLTTPTEGLVQLADEG